MPIDRPRRAPTLGVCAVLCLSAGCGGTSGDGVTTRATDAGAHAEHSGATVVMSLIAYQPDELTVATSTTVTWKQRDAGTHTVTSGTVDTDASGAVSTDADGVFGSAELEKGDAYEFTFERAGSYAYFCRIHPATMQGRITVA